MAGLTDIPGLRVGHWTGKGTGCTVVLAPEEGAVAAIDVRGGAPASFDTELLHEGRLVQRVNALVLAGGSVYGLAACTGVTRWLAEKGVGFTFGGRKVPIVCGAAIFDLGVAEGPPPDSESGYAACESATVGEKSQGRVGAGAGAMAGKAQGVAHATPGGLGMASLKCGHHVVAALAVVNAAGSVYDRQGRPIAAPRKAGGSFVDAIADIQANGRMRQPPGENTTLGIVATTAGLDRAGATKLAQMAHDGLARAIRPAHTMHDGDLIFALSVPGQATQEADVSALGAIAAEAMQDAIIAAVQASANT